MIKKIFTGLIAIIAVSTLSFNAFADCGFALPTDHPGFCASFKEKATCYCVARKDRPFPEAYCSNTKWLYGIMVSTYGSLAKACEAQKETSVQDCIDNWTCHMNGGKDSKGRICSSTRKSCS